MKFVEQFFHMEIRIFVKIRNCNILRKRNTRHAFIRL